MSNREQRVRGIVLSCALIAGAAALCSAQSQKVPTFEDPLTIQVGVGHPYGIASADFLDANGQPGQDGLPEIAVAGAGGDILFNCDAPGAGEHRLKIYRNTGTWDTNPAGALVEHQMLDIDDTKWATELAFADITGSGNPDLVLLGYDPGSGTGYLWIYRNLPNGQFDPMVFEFPTSDGTLRGLVTRDLDGDDDIDVAAAVSNCDTTGEPRNLFIVFENLTDPFNQIPSFTPHPAPIVIGNSTAPGDIVAGDFYALTAGQSHQDLVTSNPLAPSYTKVLNLGQLQFSPTSVDVDGGCAPVWHFISAASGRFGSDQWWDFAAVDADERFLGVFKGDGLGEFETFCDNAALGYTLFPDPPDADVRAYGIAAGNLNGGPGIDLVVTLHEVTIAGGTSFEPSVAVLLGRADGTFQVPSATQAYIFGLTDPIGTPIAGASLVELVDLDNDGFDDIVVTNNHVDGMYDNISILINKMVVAIEP